MVPDDGREATYAVTSRTAAEGSLLRAGTEVFKLVMDRTLKLKVPVPDRFVAEVQVGEKAKVSTAAYDCTSRERHADQPGSRSVHADVRSRNPASQREWGPQVG